MTLVPLSLPPRSNPARHGHAGNARLINCYAEDAGQEAKQPLNIHACDGFRLFADLGEGPIRGTLALDDTTMIVVAGRGIFRVNFSGTFERVGSVNNDAIVTMARNRVVPHPQVAIVARGLYYIYQNGIVTQIEDPELPSPISVTALDGYFIFMIQNGKFFLSEIDGEGVDGLDNATAESDPDDGVRGWVRGREFVAGGTRTLEFWQNTGGEFPLTRITTIQFGLLAAESVAEIEQTSVFVAHDRTVRMLDGYEPVRISTHAVDRAIAADPNPSALQACSWTAGGHSFYALSGTNFTWVYDATTQAWHERQSYGLDRWRIARAVQFGDKLIFGDYQSGRLYISTADDYDEAGSHLVMDVQLPLVHGFPHRLRHNALFVDVVPGVGRLVLDSNGPLTDDDEDILTDDDDITVLTDDVVPDPAILNPVVMMSYSDDGGAHWSTERSAPLGTIGERLRRVRFNRLGIARGRTYRFRISAAVARTLVGVTADVDKLGV